MNCDMSAPGGHGVDVVLHGVCYGCEGRSNSHRFQCTLSDGSVTQLKWKTTTTIGVMYAGGSHSAAMIGHGNGVVEDNGHFLPEILNTDLDSTGCTGEYFHSLPASSNAILSTLDHTTVNTANLCTSVGDSKVETPCVREATGYGTHLSFDPTAARVLYDSEDSYSDSASDSDGIKPTPKKPVAGTKRAGVRRGRPKGSKNKRRRCGEHEEDNDSVV